MTETTETTALRIQAIERIQALEAEVASLRTLVGHTVTGIASISRSLGDLEGKLFNFDGGFDAINRRLDKLARDADPPLDTK